jgi:hypothetical protein
VAPPFPIKPPDPTVPPDPVVLAPPLLPPLHATVPKARRAAINFISVSVGLDISEILRAAKLIA